MSEVILHWSDRSHSGTHNHAVGWVYSLESEGSVWVAKAAVARGQNHQDLATKINDYPNLEIPVTLPDTEAQQLILASYHGLYPQNRGSDTHTIAQLFDERGKCLRGENSDIVNRLAGGLENITVLATLNTLGRFGCRELTA